MRDKRPKKQSVFSVSFLNLNNSLRAYAVSLLENMSESKLYVLNGGAKCRAYVAKFRHCLSCGEFSSCKMRKKQTKTAGQKNINKKNVDIQPFAGWKLMELYIGINIAFNKRYKPMKHKTEETERRRYGDSRANTKTGGYRTGGGILPFHI